MHDVMIVNHRNCELYWISFEYNIPRMIMMICWITHLAHPWYRGSPIPPGSHESINQSWPHESCHRLGSHRSLESGESPCNRFIAMLRSWSVMLRILCCHDHICDVMITFVMSWSHLWFPDHIRDVLITFVISDLCTFVFPQTDYTGAYGVSAIVQSCTTHCTPLDSTYGGVGLRTTCCQTNLCNNRSSMTTLSFELLIGWLLLVSITGLLGWDVTAARDTTGVRGPPRIRTNNILTQPDYIYFQNNLTRTACSI